MDGPAVAALALPAQHGGREFLRAPAQPAAAGQSPRRASRLLSVPDAGLSRRLRRERRPRFAQQLHRRRTQAARQLAGADQQARSARRAPRARTKEQVFQRAAGGAGRRQHRDRRGRRFRAGAAGAKRRARRAARHAARQCPRLTLKLRILSQMLWLAIVLALVAVAAWVTVLLLELPLWIAIVVTVVAILILATFIIVRRVRASLRAAALERELMRQAAAQADKARPDRRAEILALQTHMKAALDALKRTKLGSRGGKNALYALPWYVIVGPPAAGKTTALTQSGLGFISPPGGGGA